MLAKPRRPVAYSEEEDDGEPIQPRRSAARDEEEDVDEHKQWPGPASGLRPNKRRTQDKERGQDSEMDSELESELEQCTRSTRVLAYDC